MDPLSAVMGGLPFGGFMLQTGGPMMPMGFEAKNMEDITEIGLDEDINDEEKDEINVMEVEDIDVEKEIFGLENDDGDNDDNISESSQSYSDDSDQSDDGSEDEVIDLISDQGKVEEIDVEKDDSDSSEEEQVEQSEEEEDKIVIDDSLSVKQLKSICEEMNISQSGNKSQLIKRIIDNQN